MVTGGQSSKTKNAESMELRADGWERFEKAVDSAVKSGPKHKLGKHKAKASGKTSLAENGERPK